MRLMKNKITDLNNHLFEQLERLNDPELKGDDLKTEINRASAISKVSSQIIQSARVTVDAMKLVAKGDVRKEDMPLLLENEKSKK